MPLSFDSKRELDRYFVITLSLDEALQSERWEEAASLMAERDQVLSTLEAKKVSLTAAEVEKIQKAEGRMMMALREMKDSVAQSIRSNVKRGVANRLYSGTTAPQMPGFSQAS